MNAPRENGNNYENEENAGLPAAFCARMRVQLKTQAAYAAFLASYAAPAERGILVNTLKIPAAAFEKISPFGLEKVAWSENGYYVSEEKTGKHPYHAAGLYYSQEPSAMSVAPLLDARPGERVLDLCAAPGGKSASWGVKIFALFEKLVEPYLTQQLQMRVLCLVEGGVVDVCCFRQAAAVRE